MSNQNKPSLRKPQVKAVPSRFSRNSSSRWAVRSRRRSTMVGLAPNATNPRTKQRMSSSKDGHSCRFRGTDFVQSVSSGTGLSAGQVLISLPANPRMIGVSRLAIGSSVWERFKFRSLKFHYAPIANATQTGSLIGYVDYDVNDAPTGTGDANLQRAFAHYGSQSCQIWGDPSKRTSWELKDIDPLTDLYIDSPSEDPHWTSQGRFVLLSASTVAASLPLGNIFVEYDVEFFVPQIEVTPVSGTGALILGGGVMSASDNLGSSSTTASWSNLTVGRVGNVLSLPAGAYLVVKDIDGTAIGAQTMVLSSGVSTFYSYSAEANAGATHAIGFGAYSSTAPFTITLTGTATTVTQCDVFVVMLPSTAVASTVLARISALAAMVGKLQLACASETKEKDEAKERRLLCDDKENRSLSLVPMSRDVVSMTPYNSPMSSTSSMVSGPAGQSISGGWFRA